MTEAASFHPGLERGYRRLLAAYPQSFRRDQEDEMLAVLMATAQPGQRRPGLAEVADVIISGLRMRLRRAGWGPVNQTWPDALAVLSVAAPLFVLVVGLLAVAVPYHLPPAHQDPALFRMPHAPRELGGPSLLKPGLGTALDITLGGQVIVAALALLGWRRLALVPVAATAGLWIATGLGSASWAWIPDQLQPLVAAALLLEAVALAAPPGSGPARRLVTWRHGVVLLLAAVAVQVLTLLDDAGDQFADKGKLVQATAHSSQWLSIPGPGISGYVILAAVLAAIMAGLAVVLKINRFFLLLTVAFLYPVTLELIASAPRDWQLIGTLSPGHLAVLFLPPLVLLAGAVISAYTGLRVRLVRNRPESA